MCCRGRGVDLRACDAVMSILESRGKNHRISPSKLQPYILLQLTVGANQLDVCVDFVVCPPPPPSSHPSSSLAWAHFVSTTCARIFSPWSTGAWLWTALQTYVAHGVRQVYLDKLVLLTGVASTVPTLLALSAAGAEVGDESLFCGQYHCARKRGSW